MAKKPLVHNICYFCSLSKLQPVKSETVDPAHQNHKVFKYEKSPIMSTYLLAFVIGEYDFVESTDVNGVKIRVYTPVGKKEQGQFALEVHVIFSISKLIYIFTNVSLTAHSGPVVEHLRGPWFKCFINGVRWSSGSAFDCRSRGRCWNPTLD